MTDPGWLAAVGPAPGQTLALLARQRDKTVAERYGGGVGPDTTLPSWSMAKSILHIAVGVLVGEGRLSLDAPTPVAGATLDHLLQMRAGLAWREDYEPGAPSDVQEMLFGAGRTDTAAYTVAKDRIAEPGSSEAFCYSSGTSNVVSAMVADRVGRGDDYLSWLDRAVLAPLGLQPAIPKLDGAGVWIASSYCFSTARGFASFGERCLAEGDGLLPDGWVTSGTELLSRDVDGEGYGRHWWVWGDDLGTYEAHGYNGQSVTVVPALDAVIVRLGRTALTDAPALQAWRRALVAALRDAS